MHKQLKVYMAGDLLNKGSQMQRAAEAVMIKDLGHEIYNPQDNKEINDKANANPEGLAERIVRHDTDAIIWADTLIMEPLAHAIGTNIELGQVKGMKDVAKIITEIDRTTGDFELFHEEVMKVVEHFRNQKVYVHYQDIRRQGQTETGDRRSLGVHQYMYGVVLDVTKGRGIQEWEEIVDSL